MNIRQLQRVITWHTIALICLLLIIGILKISKKETNSVYWVPVPMVEIIH